jgi:Trk K+ transport system NAD-binding subunit
VQRPNCQAVVVLISNEDIVLKIAVMAKFLNPGIRVICRSTSLRYEEHLRELDGVTVIDPFEIFAQLLSLAITNPSLHNLNSWLVRGRGVRLGAPVDIPTGDWILCGYGRMGQWLNKYMTEDGIRTTVIDPNVDEECGLDRVIREQADRRTLKEAGIERAAGIVACTDNDPDNLSILLNKQVLNPDAFAIARQNDHENQLAFDAASADLTLQSSLTTARRILKLLISPLIQTLFDYLRDQGPERTDSLIRRLQSAIGEEPPLLWRMNICREEASAAVELRAGGRNLTLGDLIKDSRAMDSSLSCVPLMLERRGECHMLPADSERIEHADEIVLCGTERSRRLLAANANNPYTLHYLVTGKELPRGYFFDWLFRMSSQGGLGAPPNEAM